MSKWSRSTSMEGLSLWWRFSRRVDLFDRRDALLRGLAWLIIATIMCWYFRVAPSSVVSFDIVGYMPLWLCLVQQLVIWLATGAMLYLMLEVTGFSCKVVELFARVLYARLPIYLLLLPAAVGSWRVPFAVVVNTPREAFSEFPLFASLYMVLVVVAVVWYWMWCYRAYASQRNEERIPSGVFFAVAIVAANELVSWLMPLLQGLAS